MTLQLHHHPLASYCQKVLIALHENDHPFERVIVDLADMDQAAAFSRISPMMKMPALVDTERGETVLESTLIIEYLHAHHAGPAPLIPTDQKAARHARYFDRIFDNYVETPMQTIVFDRLRPEGKHDPFGVEQAHTQLATAYTYLESQIPQSGWIAGPFSMAECSAGPALFYGHIVSPIPAELPRCRTYLKRLMERPSFARVLKEAEPYFAMFPFREHMSRALDL
ncbi:glutathione S-transferase family protein [Pararhizobium haloflavum]|uniref:glutathione S-transferase family protein n=1 Tax=Pararhizobium haloflavum TaxID=2037914 RepID=UPI000C176687|nr:glutathione S-transferase family protein [Pararhizobium haloflavum]